jgi:hypothetical protein
LPSSPLSFPSKLFFASTPAIPTWIPPKHEHWVHARIPARDGGPNKLQGCSTVFLLAACPRPAIGPAPEKHKHQHQHQPVRATHHPAGRDQRPPFLARLDRAVTPMDCDGALLPVALPAVFMFPVVLTLPCTVGEQPVTQEGLSVV